MKQLSDSQWKTLELLQAMLKPLYDAQTQLEGEKYVTSSLVPFHIIRIRSQLQKSEESDDAAIKEVATLLLKDFDERWAGSWPRATLMCVALDPRTKKMKCFSEEQQKQAWDFIEQR
jgi:hypothetical protein